MHQLYITFPSSVTDFLFKNWTITSPAAFAGLCIGVFIISILLQAIKEFQGVYYERCVQSLIARHRPSSESHCNQHSLHLSIVVHGLHSALYLIQVIVEYAIMLSIMKYNGWLLIAILVGVGLGYFVKSSFTPAHVDYATVDAANSLPSTEQNSPDTSLA